MLYIEIPDGTCVFQEKESSTKSLISGIKNLGTISTAPEIEEPILISKVEKEAKKKKKEKKKKEKKKATYHDYKDIVEEISEDSSDSEISLLDIDIDDIFREESDVESEIIGTQCGNYDKLKKEENPYKKEFAEEVTLLYNLLDELNKYNKKLEKKYDSLENSKTRGVSKYTTDIANAILQGKNSKLHIIKAISDIKKTIVDLKIKADAKDKSANGNNSHDLAASSYLQNIIKHGRTSFIDTLTKPDVNDGVDIDDLPASLLPTSDELNAYDNYEDEIEQRLSNEVNRYRNSEEGDTYIKYENMGIKIVIRRDISTGEWETIAVDKNNQQIFDYPVPDKASLGKVKFTEDGSYASDKFGRSYKVIEICS